MTAVLCRATFAICIAAAVAAQAGDGLPPVDEARVRAEGIRRLESRHLVLYTDLASEPAVDELPRVFDQAFLSWCKYFGVDPVRHDAWQMRAFLMADPARFQAVGLIPAAVPKFRNGFTIGRETWVHNQTSPYYRRHLLLHEGVHGFMLTFFGEHASPWYMEGMAELLATHRWRDGRLQLPVIPNSADEVSKLGRIELVQRDMAAGKVKSLADVMSYDASAHLQVEPYGWCWAAAALLDNHPRYRERFRTLPKLLASPSDFNGEFRRLFADDARELATDWQAFVADIDHGYDFEHTAIDFSAAKPLSDGSTAVQVRADRGWQNTGVRLEAGRTYPLTATGRYQVADDPKFWISEPQGVTIRYVRGKPLGMLLAVVLSDDPAAVEETFRHPIAVGRGTTIEPAATGTLYLKINDSPGKLRDNTGHADVMINAVSAAN